MKNFLKSINLTWAVWFTSAVTATIDYQFFMTPLNWVSHVLYWALFVLFGIWAELITTKTTTQKD